MFIRRLTESTTVQQKPASALLCSSHTPQKPATKPQSVIRETRPRPRRIPFISCHSCGICPRSTDSTRFTHLKVTERIAQYFSLTDKLPGIKKGCLRVRQQRDFPIFFCIYQAMLPLFLVIVKFNFSCSSLYLHFTLFDYYRTSLSCS